MTKLRCIVIDDDPTITDLISHFCDKHSSIDFCIECNNAVDGLKLISSQDFDLVFLDYNMPHLNGEQLISLKQDDSKVIMITSESSFAVDSYKYPNIVDYLLKPVTYDRFSLAIAKCIPEEKEPIIHQDKSTLPRSIMIKEANKWIPVKIDSILYIKSESNYSTLYTKGKNIMSLINLKDLQEKLPAEFLRIHRSYIVNSNHIEYYTTEEVSVEGKQLPVSGKYRAAVKEFISNF